MTKRKDPETYFEKVPLEIVKKIAEEDIADAAESGVDVPAETPVKKRSLFSRLKPVRVNAL